MAIQPDARPLAVDSGTVVGGRGAHLDREQRRERQRRHEVVDPSDRVRHGVEGDAVLHLEEVDVARAAEDPIAAVDQLAFGGRGGDELGHLRGERWETSPDAADGAEREVLADPLVAHVGQSRLRLGRGVGARVAFHLAATSAGHPVELDVIGRTHDVAEVGDHVGDRFDRLDAHAG